ncbi:MAG: EamA family transporter [Rectinemataceae bacterium]
MYVLWSVLSALLYGAADFAGGLATRRSNVESVIILSQIAGACLALIFIVAGGTPLPSPGTMAWSLAAGASGLVGLVSLYRGLARGVVAIVSPVSALVAALLPALFGIATGERPSALAMAGALLCIPAILLLSWQPGADSDKRRSRLSIIDGLVAGAGFGCFFIALSRTGHDDGLWPVAFARLASLFLMIAIALIGRRGVRPQKGSRRLAIVAGFADMGANILFLLATRSGLLSIVSVISSLFPAPTVLLARIFQKERIPPQRALGLALALAGIALIGIKGQ